MAYTVSPMYHGTAEHITAFDPERTGQGEDQYGSGFYFDSSQGHAENYAHIAKQECRGDTPNIVCAELCFQNPIVIDAAEPTLQCVSVTDRRAISILKHIPAFYDKDSDTNPLGDYLPSFWSHPPQKKSDFDHLIAELVRTSYSDTNLRQLDFLCAQWPTEFRTAVRAVTGYDGVLISYPHSCQAVEWFPDQIKILSTVVLG